MRKILNKNLHLHIKVKDKHHPINPAPLSKAEMSRSNIFKRCGINIGLVIIVILASIITWFLTEYIVYELNQMDLAAVGWVNEARPEARAQLCLNLRSGKKIRVQTSVTPPV